MFPDIAKSVRIKKLELTESHKKSSLTKKKQFNKKGDRYEVIYILKVAMEAILLYLEQYLPFVYIEVYGEFNVTTERENFHAIIVISET